MPSYYVKTGLAGYGPDLDPEDEAVELVRSLIATGGVLVVLLFLAIGFLTMRAGR